MYLNLRTMFQNFHNSSLYFKCASHRLKQFVKTFLNSNKIVHGDSTNYSIEDWMLSNVL